MIIVLAVLLQQRLAAGEGRTCRTNRRSRVGSGQPRGASGGGSATPGAPAGARQGGAGDPRPDPRVSTTRRAARPSTPQTTWRRAREAIPRRAHVCNEAARLPSPDVHRGRAHRRRCPDRRLHGQHPEESSGGRRRRPTPPATTTSPARRSSSASPPRPPTTAGWPPSPSPPRPRPRSTTTSSSRSPRAPTTSACRSARSRPSSTTRSTRSCCCPSTARR